VLCMARENTGLTLRELGEAAGGMDYAAVGEAVRRLKQRLKEDRSIRKAYKHAVQITGAKGQGSSCLKKNEKKLLTVSWRSDP